LLDAQARHFPPLGDVPDELHDGEDPVQDLGGAGAGGRVII
jgi:hypothetical protein